MIFALLFVLLLMIPILAIVLDSAVGRALAARLERREVGSASDLFAERIAYLESEVERLAAEVRRLDEEGRFLHALLESRGAPPALDKGERTD